MRFGSVCSGIEAASVAWEPLGWKAAWLSEIEPFPSAVLKHHYPDVPNLGDMTALPSRIRNGEIEAPDLFCGGTPCQAFSVAGLRKSLDDARGNLSLTFCEIANAIDNVRRDGGKPASIIFWENVPGVLSTKDNAFGCFLGALAGSDTAIVPSGRWTDAGVVAGPQRTVAWRTLDAQYFGLAQRRRRVFVVASARDGFDPAAVLLEWEGLRRDTAPSREAGQRVANALTDRADRGGTNSEGQRLIASQVSPTLRAGGNQTGGDRPPGTDVDTADSLIVAHSLRGEGFDASEDGTGRGTPLVPVAHVDTMPTMLNGANTPAGHNARSGHTKDRYIVPVAFHPTQDPISSENVCHSISSGNGQGCATAAVAVDCYNGAIDGDTTLTLRKGNGNAMGGVPATLHAMQVRRLTPVECERLQGFPDDYTAIPWRKKPASECPDGPRYKALGNSWAVPVVRWIGHRIAHEVAKLSQ